jgi:tRNA pseudouridine13 synthase
MSPFHLDFDSAPPMTIGPPGYEPGAGGGVLKTLPEDFQVEEIAAYEPSGTGEFAYLWVEKTDLTSAQLCRHVAEQLGIGQREVGLAGLKDKRAITRQWLSVPRGCEERLPSLDWSEGSRGIRLLKTSYHTNKLKTGHLKGNRFTLRVRQRDEGDDRGVQQRLDHLCEFGMANAFGPQRFGRGNTVAIGLRALDGHRIRDKRLMRLGVSALQAFLFNHWLAARAEALSLRRALLGDWLRKRVGGGMFRCDSPDLDTQRIEDGELTVTGPMFGAKYRQATDEAGALEHALLKGSGLERDSFKEVKRIAPGTRRAALIYPQDCQVERDEYGLTVAFTIPSGSYATLVMRHICGPDLDLDGGNQRGGLDEAKAPRETARSEE